LARGGATAVAEARGYVGPGCELREQGRYREAIPNKRRVTHAKTVVAAELTGLATFYQAQGRFAEAEPLFRRSLAVWDEVRGPAHAAAASSLVDYAAFLRAVRPRAEAAEMAARAAAVLDRWAAP